MNHSREERGAGKVLGAQLGPVKVQSGQWREFEGQGCVRDRHPKEQEMKHFRHEKRNGPEDKCVSRLLGEQLVRTLRPQNPGKLRRRTHAGSCGASKAQPNEVRTG